ncbi:hypothetical protein [Pseudofrankia asymbiotica]|nr:hypothetical protein [Pseudofrankia asymbiotica]
MKEPRMRRLPVPATLTLPVAATALLLAACGGGTSSTSTSPATVGANPSTAASASAPASGSVVGGTTVATGSGPAGTFLTDGSGKTLYLFMADKAGASTCAGACARAWPPLTTTAAPAASGAALASDLGTIMRSDGTTQVTYHGHPLYYYEDDKKAGQTEGQGSTEFGAKWWLVAPSGSAITTGGSGSTGAGAGGGGY